MSSANRKGCVNLEAFGRSLMYRMKNKGAKMEQIKLNYNMAKNNNKL